MVKCPTCICLDFIMDLFVRSRHNFPYSSMFSPWGFMSNLCSTFPSMETLPTNAKIVEQLIRTKIWKLKKKKKTLSSYARSTGNNFKDLPGIIMAVEFVKSST